MHLAATRTIAAAGAVALFATACSGAEGAESGGLEVSAIWTGGEQESFRAVLDAFEEQTGTTVTYTPTGSNPGAVLGTRAQGGDPPDVAILPQPGLMRDFQTRGFLEPVGDEVTTTIEEHYDPAWLDLATIDDEVYGVFFKAANKSTFWYRTDVFEDAGVEPPQTWDELLSAAATLDAYGVEPFSIAGGDGWVLTDWFENIYLRTAGPEKYDQLARHEIPWTDPSVIDALETFTEVLRDDWLVEGRDGTILTDFPSSVDRVFTDPPAGATVFEGDFTGGVISGLGFELGEGADFFPFPSIGNEEEAVLAAGDVAVLMSEREEARDLLAFLATPEAASIWAEKGGFVSPNGSVSPGTYPDEISRRAATMLHDAEAFQFDLADRQPGAFGATVGRGMWRLLQDLVVHPDEVERIAEELEEAATEAWASLEDAGQEGEG